MATTLSPHNKTSTVVRRSTTVADPSVAGEPTEIAAPLLINPAPERPARRWLPRFLRTDPALPSPRDFVLAHADPTHTVRSIQR